MSEIVNEQTIIEYIQRGYSNKYISLLLNITVDHVEVYREILKKEAESYMTYGNFN